MSNETKTLEERVKKLEETVREAREDAEKLKESLGDAKKLLEQVKEAPKQIEALDKRIGELKEQASNIEKKLATEWKKRIVALEEQAEKHEQQIGKLDEKIDTTAAASDKKLNDFMEACEKRFVELDNQVKTVLPALISQKASEARAQAEATAKALVDELAATCDKRFATVEQRIAELENQVKTVLPELITAKASDARAQAEATAKGYVDTLDAALQNQIKTLEQKNIDLNKKIDDLAVELKELRNPTPAAVMATRLLPKYRGFDDAELKLAIAEDRLDVLAAIASRLNPRVAADGDLLSRMVKSAEDAARMAEIVSAAGSNLNGEHP